MTYVLFPPLIQKQAVQHVGQSIISSLLVTSLTMALENNRGPLTNCSNDSLAPLPQPLAHRKRGTQHSVHIIGLFDVHEGESCHLLRPGGMEQVMMTIGVLENQLMTGRQMYLI
ncbi:uncharacterized protein TNIN_50761 [Trichonephila inaurata madagascariensis]|uniref:Uncharacterized protein n=1 Tax=Trichonephila inaurata madagascariensis TaxID=2747483 RepID=A0A8X6Y0C9_9ARAC|nr:uncharacterized protein TNIN_50761 [Trichonephila inaurata madagascariensis]